MTPSEAPKALQASECSELLDPMRASCWISAQRWPGKLAMLQFEVARHGADGWQDNVSAHHMLSFCLGKFECECLELDLFDSSLSITVSQGPTRI